jgi:hypothetical protein
MQGIEIAGNNRRAQEQRKAMEKQCEEQCEEQWMQ